MSAISMGRLEGVRARRMIRYATTQAETQSRNIAPGLLRLVLKFSRVAKIFEQEVVGFNGAMVLRLKVGE